jgi:hypothetical protein
MSRYSFHVKAGDTVLTEEDGVDLQDLDVALADAVESAKDLVETMAKTDVEPAMIVTNEAGDVITNVPVHKA